MRGLRLLAIGLLLVAAGGPAHAQDEAATRQIEHANGLYSRGWYDDAIVEYEGFLKNYPNDPRVQDARYFYAESLYQMGQWEPALEAFEKEIASSPDSPWRTNSLFRKGMILYRLDQKAGAVQIFETVLKRPDVEAETKQTAYLSLGRALTDTGQPDRAQTVFRKSLEEFPGGDLNAHIRFELARVALAEKKLDDALTAFREVAAQPTGEFAAEAAYRVAEILHAQRKYPEAAKAYIAARDGFPDSRWRSEAGYHAAWCAWHAGDQVTAASEAIRFLDEEKTGTMRPGMLYLRGQVRSDQGQFDAALDDFDAAVAAASAPVEGLSGEQKAYGDRAAARALWTLYRAGRDEELLRRSREWLSANRPQGADGEVRYLSGEANYRVGDLQNALLDFLDLLTNYPESPFRKSALARIAWCQFRLKDFAKAAQFFDRFVELYPEDELTPGAVRSAADSLYAAGDAVLAATRYRSFVDGYPEAAGVEEALYRLGVCYYRQKDYDRMARVYAEFLTRFPDSPQTPNAAYWVGYDHYRSRRYAEAIASFERVTARSQDSPFADEARVQRAASLFLIGNATAAARAYYDIAKAHPNIELATQTLLWTGEELNRLDRYDEAADTFQILMDRYPYEDIIEISLYRIGQAMLEKQDWARALPAFQRLLANYGAGPFGDDAAYGLGRALMGLGRYQDAIDPLTRVTQGRHELSAQANILLGDSYRELGKFTEANRAYTEVALIHDDPRFVPKAIFYAGETFESLGRTDRALEMYRDLDQRFPLSPYNGKAKERILALGGASGSGASGSGE